MQINVPRYGTSHEVIGLPSRAFVISNSERTDAMCPLRWFYRYGLGLQSKASEQQSRGAAFHEWLADLFTWWQRKPMDPYPGAVFHCVWCGGVGCPQCLREAWTADMRNLFVGRIGGPLGRYWGALDLASPEDGNVAAKEADRVLRMAQGYLYRYGKKCPADTTIVGVELKIAAPIRNAKGKPYCSTVRLVNDAGTLRYAKPGERGKSYRWPWYQVGTLDVVTLDASSDKLWFWEHKTSATPDEYLRGLTVDPQVAGYAWLLGSLHGQDAVGGYVYNVISTSYQYDPAILKDGSISRDKRLTVPSWRYLDKTRELGIDPEPYEEHIGHLRSAIDPKLYRREWGGVGTQDVDRYGAEIFGIAQRIAQYRRNVALATTPAKVAELFPRMPVCRLPGGSCPFGSLCVNDSEDGRTQYERHSVTWSEETKPTNKSNPMGW